MQRCWCRIPFPLPIRILSIQYKSVDTTYLSIDYARVLNLVIHFIPPHHLIPGISNVPTPSPPLTTPPQQ